MCDGEGKDAAKNRLSSGRHSGWGFGAVGLGPRLGERFLALKNLVE
jgi:hypothetical protein